MLRKCKKCQTKWCECRTCKKKCKCNGVVDWCPKWEKNDNTKK